MVVVCAVCKGGIGAGFVFPIGWGEVAFVDLIQDGSAPVAVVPVGEVDVEGVEEDVVVALAFDVGVAEVLVGEGGYGVVGGFGVVEWSDADLIEFA
jgi:hypothetical protein